uniref:Uncharacterized protein n=1 Tax=Periophthalmus magnuspinnatus TaxID=409849 RepID=A0A3B4AII3_9GOBI
MVLGIPTVRREKQSYLLSTLDSLLYDLSPSQCQDLLIIVFVAEVHKLRKVKFLESSDTILLLLLELNKFNCVILIL